MFQKLKKKYKWLLFTPVTLVVICYSIAVFFSYCSILKDDYREKLAYFNKQQVSNVEKSLWRAEFSMNALLSHIDTEMAGTFFKYEILNELKKVSDYNLEISTAFMISSEAPYIITDENYALASYLLRTYPELFDNSAQGMRWYYLKYDSSADNLLLCAKTILDSYGTVYTFCLAIRESTVLPVVSVGTDKGSIFAKNNFSFSIRPSSDSLLYMSSSSENYDSLEITKSETTNTFSTKINSTPFTLLMQVTEESLDNMLLVFFAGIIFFCIALLFVAYFIMDAFMKRLTTSLESFSNQFSHFFDTLDQ